MLEHIKKISQKLQSNFYFDFDMAKNVWFRAGGKTSVFCLVYDFNELEIILNEIKSYPYEIIGVGSNLLVRDKGFNGIILKLGRGFNKIEISDSFIEVGASILDNNLSKFAEKNSIKNLEFYSGIPGSIGGAVKMNAGCYGFETKDILEEIKLININREVIDYKKDQLKFTYRESNLPSNSIILSAKYKNEYGDKGEIESNIALIRKKRENTQPIKFKTSGSTFKNPTNEYAAKLIEQAGCKGLGVGDVYVSQKHANFLINEGNASASDIENLGNLIINKVYESFNIQLEWEIRIIG